MTFFTQTDEIPKADVISKSFVKFFSASLLIRHEFMGKN